MERDLKLSWAQRMLAALPHNCRYGYGPHSWHILAIMIVILHDYIGWKSGECDAGLAQPAIGDTHHGQ